MKQPVQWSSLWLGGVLAAGSLLYLQGLRILNGEPFTLTQLLAQAAFIAASLAGSQLLHTRPALRLAWLPLAAVVGVLYWLGQTTLAAWAAMAAACALSLSWANQSNHTRRWFRWLVSGILAGGLFTGVAVVLGQIEGHFGDEEFFAAIQIPALGMLWLLLWAADRCLRHGFNGISPTPPQLASGAAQTRFWQTRAGKVVAGLGWALGLSLFGLWAVLAYQGSFYPLDAPAYPGIDANKPFLCGKAPPDPQAYAGPAVFQQLIDLVAANPDKGTNEYGWLALSTGNADWAQVFHDRLLDEASQARFTEPAGSVKYGQCEAAQRAYAYTQLARAQPNLFSPQEVQDLQRWFTDINRRALTVEPVDWMYALAFQKMPSGPYENQECGAALLAVLEYGGLADPALHTQNQQYLANNRRGWEQRFRNNDDSFIYQVEWLRHAFYQASYTGAIDPVLQRQSFDWYLLQSLPDGSPLNYNHVIGLAPEVTAYWATSLFQDPQHLWLAGRSAEWLAKHGETLFARSPAQQPLSLQAASPGWGSCLLYGNSGIPTRVGPLAPDKIVFRDGWQPGSLYMLLNLRFTGWHRYKGTNAIVLLYQDGPLVQEKNQGEAFAWLPVGRALFRDKRIPRQNLNGLLIHRSGLNAVLYTLTSLGSSWAQDPPGLARVENFTTTLGHDHSTTVLEGWHGWQHRRTIDFFSSGPVVVVDHASGPADVQAALAWQLTGSGEQVEIGRLRLRGGEQPAEVLFISLDGGGPARMEIQPDPVAGLAQVLYQGDFPGRLSLATVFLTGPWVGAPVSLSETGDGIVLKIQRPGQAVEIPIER